MKRWMLVTLGILLSASAARAEDSSRGTPSPTPVPPSVHRAKSVTFRAGALPRSNAEFKGIPADEFYRRLTRDLAPYLGGARKKPTKFEKFGQAVGCAVGIGCAAVAAGQATGILHGNDAKKTGKGDGKQGKPQSLEASS